MQAINLTQVQEAINQRDAKVLSTESTEKPPHGYESAKATSRAKAELLTAKLWPMMSQAYGYKFASQFGDEPSDVWIGALQGITGEQMANALLKCAEIYPQWPPGAIEFRSLCEGRDPRNVDDEGNDAHWQHKIMEARTKEFDEQSRRKQLDLVDITRKERSREMGAETLTNLKAMFKGV